MKYLFRRMQTRRMPAGYDIDTHFNPPYEPWDQRICLAADGDIYEAIKQGRVEMVTDHIDHFDAIGIALKSGRHWTPTSSSRRRAWTCRHSVGSR